MDSRNPNLAVVQSFVEQYPNGPYTKSALSLIERLKQDTPKQDMPQAAPEPAPSADANKKAENTVAALSDTTNRSTTTPTEMPSGQALASDIQQQLKRVGCYDETVDGKWGETTRCACRTARWRASLRNRRARRPNRRRAARRGRQRREKSRLRNRRVAGVVA
jgi:hypothetical protein